MRIQPNLFERVFRQPATDKVTPEENLATEVTAYFLDSFAPFRKRFLSAMGVDDPTGCWDARTQVKLYAPGRAWDGKIPDLVVSCAERMIEVVVEVKIDAAPTFDYDEPIPQTKRYREYLDDARESGRISQKSVLATLTRWSPGVDLAGPAEKYIRFSHVADWLDESAEETTNEHHGNAQMARQWAMYLRQRRWAMVKLSQRHVDAIRAMSELQPQLWDFVYSATDELVATEKWKKQGKSSSGTHGGGTIAWAAPLGSSDVASLQVQIGFYFGTEGDEAVLCPVLHLRGAEADLSSLNTPLEEYWGGQLLRLENLAAKIRDDTGGDDLWDSARTSVVETVEQILKIVTT